MEQNDILRLTTPIKIRIKSAEYMIQNVVQGVGYAKTQFSKDRFQLIRCRGVGNWYKNNIGEEWDALPFAEGIYRINNGVGCGFFFIDERDCVTVNENSQPHDH